VDNERIKREQEFHNQIFNDKSRIVTQKFYSIFFLIEDRYVSKLRKLCPKKKVLEYGCGEGSTAYQLAAEKAQVTGIDISDFAIQQASTKAQNIGLAIDFRQMNAEELDFADHEFDLICGSGILHHLDIHKAYAEIARVLKPDGKALFMEPLGHNFLINWYRNRTPHLRTEDEHPLLKKDILLLNNYFIKVRYHFFFMFSLPAILFRNTFVFKPLLYMLHGFDKLLFFIFPFLRWQSWFLLIELSEPKKEIDIKNPA
jgi:ubiquinone/menaquinone biosynthesis C-methylase UbiE